VTGEPPWKARKLVVVTKLTVQMPSNTERMFMGRTATTSDLIPLAEEYYRRADAGRPDLVDLFTEDVELYFPKFGVRRGKTALGELAAGLLGSLKSIEHDRLCALGSRTLARAPRRPDDNRQALGASRADSR
jgi:hypothetical protein